MKKAFAAAAVTLAVVGASLGLRARPTAAVEPPPSPYALRTFGPELVLQLPWGPEGVGRLEEDQASPEGPMSFAPGRSDDVWILDQVHGRLCRFALDGALLSALPLPSRTTQDFELLEDGTLLLLDRYARQSVMVIDPSGAMIREEALPGEGIPDGPGVSAMVVQPDGVWIEFEHTHSVRVLDENLLPAERKVLPGRAQRADGRVVAALDGLGGATIRIEHDGKIEARAQARFEHRVDRICWVEPDRHGNVVALFHLLDFGDEPGAVVFDGVAGVLFDPLLQERAVLRSPYAITRWEQFREFRVEPDATVWQMAFTEAGVMVLRWRFVP